jgi:hypothetical protein
MATMLLGEYLGPDSVDYILIQLLYPCPNHGDRTLGITQEDYAWHWPQLIPFLYH